MNWIYELDLWIGSMNILVWRLIFRERERRVDFSIKSPFGLVLIRMGGFNCLRPFAAQSIQLNSQASNETARFLHLSDGLRVFFLEEPERKHKRMQLGRRERERTISKRGEEYTERAAKGARGGIKTMWRKTDIRLETNRAQDARGWFDFCIRGLHRVLREPRKRPEPE